MINPKQFEQPGASETDRLIAIRAGNLGSQASESADSPDPKKLSELAKSFSSTSATVQETFVPIRVELGGESPIPDVGYPTASTSTPAIPVTPHTAPRVANTPAPISVADGPEALFAKHKWLRKWVLLTIGLLLGIWTVVSPDDRRVAELYLPPLSIAGGLYYFLCLDDEDRPKVSIAVRVLFWIGAAIGTLLWAGLLMS